MVRSLDHGLGSLEGYESHTRKVYGMDTPHSPPNHFIFSFCFRMKKND